MEWTLPGTIIGAKIEDAPQIEQLFRSMFMGGGIMLGQISAITGLEAYDVQNWVKRGFLAPPEGRRYHLNQLCRILNINMLRKVLSMDQISGLLGYINGQLNDESDDLIDDSQLYFMFVRLAAHYRITHGGKEDCLELELSNYQEAIPGAKERVKRVLSVMLTAWASAQLMTATQKMLAELKNQVNNDTIFNKE